MEKEKFGRITICQAKPFVRISGQGRIQGRIEPLDAPNFEWEKDLLNDGNNDIKGDIRSSKNEIELKISGCSMNDVKDVLDYGRNSVVQLSGHGGVNRMRGSGFACFESAEGDGVEHIVYDYEIANLFKAYKDSVKVVFLSICHSEEIGRKILAAGVPHVLCCKRNERFHDRAMIQFARNLYHGLACGKSLLESFNAARAVPSRFFCNSEFDKIILLPDQEEKGKGYEHYHDVDVFFQDSSTKLPYEPPDLFWGRQEEMYRALKIKQTGLVQITGPDGIGKSSLAKAVCKHIYERPRQFLIEHIIWIDDQQDGTQYDGTIYSEFPKIFQEVLIKNSSDCQIVKSCSRVSNVLAKKRTLLVIDARDLEPNVIKRLEKMVAHIFGQTKGARVMTICRPSKLLRLERVLNYEHVMLSPLNPKKSAQLFVRIILKTRRAELDMQKFCGITFPDVDPLEKTEFMSNRSKNLYNILGNGIPFKIHKQARDITNGKFQELIAIDDKPEVSRRIDSHYHLEQEIKKIQDDIATCEKDGQVVKASDLDSLLKELENFRKNLPDLSELALLYKTAIRNNDPAKAQDIENRIQKVMDANRTVVAPETVTQTSDDLKDEEIKRLKSIIEELQNPGKIRKLTLDSSGKSDSCRYMFSLIVSKQASIVDFSYEPSNKFGIVCATNETCRSLCAGATGSVLQAGGEELEKDILQIPQRDTKWGIARCSTGDALILGSELSSYGKLHAPYIIFAVGPSYHKTDSDNIKIRKDLKLRSAYQESLKRAKEHKLEAVGFSLISAGHRSGGDLNRTLRIAVEEISRFQGYKELKQITICAFTKKESIILEENIRELGVDAKLV